MTLVNSSNSRNAAVFRTVSKKKNRYKGIAYAYDKTRRGSNDYCPATTPDLASLDIFQRVISIFGGISKKTTGNYVWILGPTRPLIEPVSTRFLPLPLM